MDTNTGWLEPAEVTLLRPLGGLTVLGRVHNVESRQELKLAKTSDVITIIIMKAPQTED